MSKNTGTSELINYFDLGVNGDVGIAGSLDINTIANATTDTDTFLVSDTGIIKYRTGAQLLSDIGAAPAVAGGYVPYTGATTNVDLGVYNLTTSAIIANGSGSNSGIVHLESNAIHSLVNGYGSIASGTTNQFNLYQTTGAGVFRGAIFSLNSITEFATRTFTLPNTDGTIALTSQIPANPVGGTGTTNYLPKFTGSTTIGNSSITDDGTIVSILNSSFTDVLRVGSTTRFLYFYPDSGSVNIMTGAGFTGSGITFAGFSNYLDFNTNSLTRMRLTTAGNLVLGPNPFTDNGARLQVSGTANFTDNVQSSSFFRSNTPRTNSITIGVSANTNYGYIGNDNMWGFRTGTSGDFNVDVNNSSSPINAFKIAQNGAATFSSSVKAGNFIVSEKSTGGLLMGATNGIDADIVLEVSASGAATKFGSIGSSGTGNLVLAKNGGNVGIGTGFTPSYPLHVYVSVADWGAVVQNLNASSYGMYVRGGATNGSTSAFYVANTASTMLLDIKGSGAASFNGPGGRIVRIDGPSNTDNYLSLHSGTIEMFIDADFTNSSGIVGTQSSHNLILRTAGTNKVWITPSGNVLIGTGTDNGSKLRVEGGELRVTTSNSGVALYQSGGNGEIAAYNWGGGAYIPLVHVGSEHRFNSSTTERMRITSGGYLKASNDGTYVAVGGNFHEFTASANGSDALLVRHKGTDPYGSEVMFTGASPNNTSNWFFYASDSTNSKFIVYSNGNVVNRNNSYGAISDVKLKENIEDATPKLEDLMKVKVRNYNLIGDDKKQIGVIAQELKEVFPAMIEETPDKDKDGNNLGTTTKSVKYSVFVPMLIKAIQEQQQQIQELKNKLL